MLLKRPDIANIIRQDLTRAGSATDDPYFQGQREAYQKVLSLLDMEESAGSHVVKIDRQFTINIPWVIFLILPLLFVL